MTTTQLAVVAEEQCVLTYNFFVCSKVAPAYLIIMSFKEASFSLMSIAEPSFDYLYFYEKSRIPANHVVRQNQLLRPERRLCQL